MMTPYNFPPPQGLYDPALEKDSCGVGFVVNFKGRRSHDIVQDGLQLLNNLFHRGATGADPNVGDGAGMLVQLPDAFLRKVCQPLGIVLPEAGRYAVGMLFLPQEDSLRLECETILGEIAPAEGLRVLGWRRVPVNAAQLGQGARDAQPFIAQVFLAPEEAVDDAAAFERRLYVARRVIEKEVAAAGVRQFYVSSLSCRTIVYKGMLTSLQMEGFFPDLSDEMFTSAIALVHARYSTNTFPSWELAQPLRCLAHNGEINTLRGNVNWMTAREKNMVSPMFGEDIHKIVPTINPTGSDSAMFDNVFEFLVMNGRTLPHAMMMMIPEAWDGHVHMEEERIACYEYHATLMEPWDGPAAMGFSDGVVVGATLDRNGLRPARIWVTNDDRVIMASETGVLPVAPENVRYKTRLQPGRIFVVDTAEGRVIDDEEVKQGVISKHPYLEWVRENVVDFESLPEPPKGEIQQPDPETLLLRQQVFGYSKEDLKVILPPMVAHGEEPIGSMGNDAPIAVLSDRPRLLFNYFKQNFAQVTNPAIDSIREDLVMSLVTLLGREGNLLDTAPTQSPVLRLHTPLLTNYDLERLRHWDGSFRAMTLPMVYPVADGEAGLERHLEQLKALADDAVRNDFNLIVLSDRAADAQHAPIPSLLASAAVHHHLIREGTRSGVGLIVETGEAREVHHFALLVGYGATAINPYLALETIVDEGIEFRRHSGEEVPKAVQNYIKAVNKGLLKVFSKMGISTLQSYHGAQIFEALGLNSELIDKYFCNTPSRIGGIGLAEIAQEVERRHRFAFPRERTHNPFLDVGGVYQFRRDGEHHMVNPDVVLSLQKAVRLNSQEHYDRFAELINDQSRRLGTLRGLMEFKRNPIPLEEVEPASEIVKRFCTGAMSLGSISREAHETLAIAMNRLGGRSNTGEGGEDPARFTRDPNGDNRNSAIKQVASGRFGVNSNYLINARELQIKIAQGAKPGEGGQLPGHKVDHYIGSIRFTTPGVALISPPPHHDIYSIEDLKQLIFDLKNANPAAAVSVKLVSETGVGTVAAGVSKAKADLVLIAGHDGGTGASPQSSIQHAGTPWELGLAETQQTLVLNNLRSRIRVQVDGQLKTGRDVVIGALLGAEEFGFSTAPLVALGCIMMRVCHLNTCPVGIATQDARLRKKFQGGPEHVVRYFTFVAEEVRRHMADLGFRTLQEMVGRVDRLQKREAVDHWKAHGLDLSNILYQPKGRPGAAIRCVETQDHGLDTVLDHELIALSEPALARGEGVAAELPITNANLATGTMLGSRISGRYGAEGLAEDTIQFKFTGSAGQSFGAFIPRGLTLSLAGDANDYLGKGLSGGKIFVFPPPGSRFAPEDNIIVGNVVLYGATSGEAFFSGRAGERFCVRNSGAHTVVEGVGDHGCEYMTGGRVVVIGETGRNFAAGMSGGIAYVLDEKRNFPSLCNMQMVELETPADDDLELIRDLLEKHVRYTGSAKAKRLLGQWETTADRFTKVMPVDYKRILSEMAAEQREIA